jgi:predicted permease
VLLAGAGMMTHNFDAYVKRDHGWDPNNLLTASVALPEATRYNADAQKIEFHRKLEARLAAIPGVEQSALGTLLPINFITDAAPMEVAGQTPVDRSQQPIGNYGMVTADYFSALRIPFVEGRAFDPDIRADSPQVIIINQSLARHFWPKGGALGQKIAELEHNKKVWREIVGVVRDVELAGNPTDTTPYYIYRPLVQSPWGIFSIVLRGPAPASFAPALRQAVADLDPDLTVDNIQTVPEAIDEGQHDIILAGRAIAGFAFLGLVLAGVGLYGVISNIVAQRTGEFGIRLALGASPNDVLRLVLRRGLWLSLLGIAIGLVGAYGAGRFLISLMPKIEGADPIGLLLVSAFLLAVALFACWVPARRATKIDPLIALRAE